MARQNVKSPTAQAYAQSLLELANEANVAAQIAQELDGLRQILRDNPSFKLYLSDPGIGADERREAMDRIFRNNVSQLALNFLGVINSHGRLNLLEQIIDSFEDLLEEQLGKIEVDLYVAKKLGPEQLENVRQRVSAALKKDAVVHQYEDPSVIGGLVLRVGDKMIDASTRYQLRALKEKLMTAPLAETL
jgi:F-type H+-transporting ATPase subunit delta